MNDEIKGAQAELEGAQATPGTGASEKKGADASETQSLAAQVREELSPFLSEIKEIQKDLDAIKKSQQSTKDKRIHNLQDKVGSLEDTTARLEKHLGLGKSPGEAMQAVKAELQNEQFVQDFKQVKERVDNLPVGDGVMSLVEREAVVLKSLETNANDPRILKIQQEAGSPEEYVKRLEEEWWDLKNKPRGKAADIAPEGGGPPPTEASLRQKLEEYDNELAQLKQTTPGDYRAIDNIRKKYIKKYPELASYIG